MQEQSIDKALLADFGNLELLAKQVVEGFITGLHKSPFHGFSVEFAEHRIYNPGESTRHIDWKLYGRTDKLFTKKYEEETNLRCQLLIDCSSSMFFPKDAKLTKLIFSMYAAASLIELLRRQRDAVGLTIFSDQIHINSKAKSSPAHHRFLYAEMEKWYRNYDESAKRSTDTIQTLHDIAELSHKRSLVILFTDLLGNSESIDEMFQALNHLKHNKHEVVIFHVSDSKIELDFELDNRPYQLIDMETGEKIKVQPTEIREKYIEGIRKYMNEVKLRCADYRIDFVEADINEGYHPVLIQYLLKREKMF